MLLCIYKYFYVCLNKLYTPNIMSKLDTICIATICIEGELRRKEQKWVNVDLS